MTEFNVQQHPLPFDDAHYRTLFEEIPISLYRTTPDGRFLDVNLAMVTMLDYPSREALLAIRLEDVYVHREDRERWKTLLKHAEVVRNFEFQVSRYDGEMLWLSNSVRAVKDEHGHVRYYEGGLEDITERKRMETEREQMLATAQQQRHFVEAVQQASTALTSTLEYEDVLKRILEQMGTVVPHDTTNIMLIEGQQVQLIQGVGYEKFDTQLLITSISLELNTTPIFQRMQTTGQPEAIPDVERDPEWVYSRPEHRWIKSYAGAPIRFHDQVIGFLNVNSATPEFYTRHHADQLLAFADQSAIAIQNARLYRQAQKELAERRRIEAELRRYQEQLEELVKARTCELEQATRAAEEARMAAEAANRSKSVFLANMSHELRTPLNAILGFAQILAREPHTSDEAENLQIIQRSGEHLLTLINQVLDLSKIEAGKITLNEKEFDLHGLLHDVKQMFILKTHKKGLCLEFEYAADAPLMIKTDEVKLRQVLINLLANAVKFTETGSVSLRVCAFDEFDDLTYSTTQQLNNLQAHTLLFEIADTGPGIAPEELDNLFQAFAQTETGRQAQEGTGLGLAISRKFVQLMGGDITVRSEPGKGSVFRVIIRYKPGESAANQPSQTTRQPVALAPDQPHYRILVVDDKPENRTLLVKLLQPFGFDLREASNGQEALEIWAAWRPHLIWMDVRMPVMDGYQATRQIKATEQGLNTVIVALSASILEEDQALVFAAGGDDFLRKPYRDTEIFALLEKHLLVQFVYTETAPVADERAFNPESFVALPETLQAELTQNVLALNYEASMAVIVRIREYDPPLAEALAELVGQYRFDTVQAFLQENDLR